MKWNNFFFNLLPRLYSNIICKNIVKIFWKFEVGYTQTSTPLESTTMWHPKRSHYNVLSPFVVTLTLGSRPRQGLVRVHAKREAQESHLPGVQESVREWTFTLPSQPTLGIKVLMDSQIFRKWLHKSKPIGLKSSLYH
jgi:hypothetical protein